MPGEKSVGSVSVRVVPDTTGFGEKVKAELSKIRDLTVTVNLELDKGAVEAELAKLSAKNIKIPAQVDLKQDQIGRALAGRKIHIPAEVDVDQNAFAKAIAGFKPAKIKTDVDTSKLSSLVSKAFAGIGPEHIRAEVDIDKASLERALAPIAEKQRIQVKVQAEIDRGLLQAQLEHLKLKADIEADQAAFDHSLRNVIAGHSKFDKLKLEPDDRPIRTALNAAKNLGSDVFSSLGETGSRVFSGIAENITDAFSGLSGIAGVAGGLAKVSAIASAIAVGGAAITAAWGAASTAVAAVPAAIGLIGAPLATVLLGMDGIKKAAQTLAPEFTKLKTAVSATFQKQLTPVFTQLKGVMTALTPSIQAVATSLAGLAQQTANWITKSGGLAQIQTVFTNVAAALKQINLVPLLDGFTRLAGNQAALSALTTTVNELGLQIQAIANNSSLDEAFKGLEGTLQALTKGFGDLVNNGITLFAKAAPGVNAVVNSLTSFFSKFNWSSLGTSVSGVFSGLAQAIDGIDPATITGIETAFAGLANVFRDPAFQANIQKIAGALPAVINQVGALTKVFADFAGGAGQVLTAFDTIDQGFQKFQLSLDGIAKNIGTSLFGDNPDPLGLNALNDRINEILGITPTTIEKHLSDAEAAAAKGAQGVHDGIVPPLRNIETETGVIFDGTREGVVGPMNEAATQAQAAGKLIHDGVVNNVRPIESEVPAIATNTATGFNAGIAEILNGAIATGKQIPPAILTPIEILKQKIPVPARAVGESFGTNASSSILAGLAQASSSVDTGFVPVQNAATAGTQGMVDAVNTAIPGLGTAMQTGLTAVQTLVTTAFGTNLSMAVGTGMLQLQNAVTLGLVGVQTAFTTGLGLVATNVTTFFAANLSLAVGTGMLQMQNAVTLGLVGVQTAFTTGLGLVGTNVTTFFATTFSLAVGTGMLQMQNAVTIGLVGVQTAFTTGLGLVGTQITTFFATTLSMAVGTGMLQVANAVTVGMVAVGAAFTAGFGLVNTAVGTAMTNVTAAVTAGFTGAVGAVNTGMGQIKAAVDTGAVQVVTAATTMMTNLTKAITDGGALAVAAVTDMMAKIIAAIPPDALNAVGGQLIQGMAAGMIAAIPAVEEAARQAVQKAVAAAQAEANTGSPSKLFRDSLGRWLTLGQAKGQLDEIPAVEDAARQAVRAAATAARAEMAASDVFDSSGLHASVSASVRGGDGASAGALGSSPTVININGSDSRSTTELANTVKFRFRTGRRGVHATR